MVTRRRSRRAVEPAVTQSDTLQVAGYRDLEVIGRGASATVYRALQENFGRVVAVKVMHVDVSDRKAQRRFEREKAINGRLSNHPNVVTPAVVRRAADGCRGCARPVRW